MKKQVVIPIVCVFSYHPGFCTSFFDFCISANGMGYRYIRFSKIRVSKAGSFGKILKRRSNLRQGVTWKSGRKKPVWFFYAGKYFLYFNIPILQIGKIFFKKYFNITNFFSYILILLFYKNYYILILQKIHKKKGKIKI